MKKQNDSDQIQSNDPFDDLMLIDFDEPVVSEPEVPVPFARELAPEEPNDEYKKKKKRKKWWLIPVILVAVLLIIGIGFYLKVRSVVSEVNTVEIDETALAAVENEEVINIALYGIDSYDTEQGRSDVIMILTIDPNRKTCRLCSLMRDSYVEIEGYGMDKINHAYAYGGPELAMKTLNQNFGLNIEHFASIDFSGIQSIVDSLGGVDIEITQEEVDLGTIPGVTAAGAQTLSGEQALAYCRIRYASGDDYQRTQRQRNVLNQLIYKLLQQPTSEWVGLIEELLPLITTNYTTDEIIDLALKYGSYAGHGMKEVRFPLDGESAGATIDDVYYLTFDIPQLATRIQDFVYNAVMP